MNLINGHKTQIGATAGILVGFALTRGWIDNDVAQVILGIISLWTAGAIAHSEIKKAGK